MDDAVSRVPRGNSAVCLGVPNRSASPIEKAPPLAWQKTVTSRHYDERTCEVRRGGHEQKRRVRKTRTRT